MMAKGNSPLHISERKCNNYSMIAMVSMTIRTTAESNIESRPHKTSSFRCATLPGAGSYSKTCGASVGGGVIAAL